MGRYRFLLGIVIVSTVFILVLFTKILFQPVISEIPSTKIASSLFSVSSITAKSTSVFTDETFIRGIVHRHFQKKETVSSIEDSLGAGVCILDFNNDGWDDIFFISGSGDTRHFGLQSWWEKAQGNRLYKNIDGKYFSDVSERSGLSAIDFGLACASADINQDGFVDLVTANKGGNRIYRNLGDGTFKLENNALHDDPRYFSTSILVKDFNGDGKADLLFGNYINFKQEQNTLELNAGYQTYKSISFDPSLYDAQPDILFLNIGEFEFKRDDSILPANKHGRTLGFYETENGILALNDKGSPSQVITDSKHKELQQLLVNARGATTLVTPNMDNGEKLFVASDAAKGGLHAFSLIDNKYINDKSWDYGINNEDRLYLTGWSVLSGDFNGDGLIDIFVSNGSAYPHPDTTKTTLGQPNTLLLAKAGEIGYSYSPLVNERTLSGRGAAILDFNNDGALDIVINNNNDYSTLLTNSITASDSWVGLKCIPVYLCEEAKIAVNEIDKGNVFEHVSSYMSQFNPSFIIRHIQSKRIELAINSKKIHFKKNIASYNRYYLINMANKSISEINRTSKFESNKAELNSFDELKYRIYAGIRDDRSTELMIQNRDISNAKKHELMNLIKTSGGRDYFPLVDFWAKDADPAIATAAIDLLSSIETEETIPTLINLIKSDSEKISCAASAAFEHYYWKDEAVVERKNWAVSHLVQTLSQKNNTIVACAIDALGESENYRALSPLIGKLKSSNNWVASRAARALGMIRQTEAVPFLIEALTQSSSPTVRAQSLIALVKLNVNIDPRIEASILTKDDFFNAMLALQLRELDDGVSATKMTSQLTDDTLVGQYVFLEDLTSAQISQVYEDVNGKQISEHQIDFLKNRPKTLLRNHLTIEDFEFLQRYQLSEEQIAKAYLQLEQKDQNKIIDHLSPNILWRAYRRNNTALSKVCAHHEHSEKDSICMTLLALETQDPVQIKNVLIMLVNSGNYQKLYLIADIKKKDNAFIIAKNMLLLDDSISTDDKKLLLENIQFTDMNLTAYKELFNRSGDSGKFAILLSANKNISPEAKRMWLGEILNTKPSKDIEIIAKKLLFSSDGRAI